MSTYAKANRTAQWFSTKFSSAIYRPNKGCWHSTETMGWPGYDGGAKAPGYTVKPDIPGRRALWRAHFEDEESSRALVNLAGGVQTNVNRVVQIEIVGTCDPKHSKSWNGQGVYLQGRDYLFVPASPDWFLDELAAFVADMNRRHGIPLTSKVEAWRAYPSSYGPTSSRLTQAEWNAFTGWCGHQHVPENNHGDPGNFPMATVLAKAAAILKPPTPVPPKPTWEDDEMLSPEAINQIRAVVREEIDKRDTAETVWTRHTVVCDTRSGVADCVNRVTPSTLVEDTNRVVSADPPPVTS